MINGLLNMKPNFKNFILLARDGDLFESVLQYLRIGKILIDINHTLLRQDLRIEVQFYHLDGLVNLLEQKSFLRCQSRGRFDRFY